MLHSRAALKLQQSQFRETYTETRYIKLYAKPKYCNFKVRIEPWMAYRTRATRVCCSNPSTPTSHGPVTLWKTVNQNFEMHITLHRFQILDLNLHLLLIQIRLFIKALLLTEGEHTSMLCCLRGLLFGLSAHPSGLLQPLILMLHSSTPQSWTCFSSTANAVAGSISSLALMLQINGGSESQGKQWPDNIHTPYPPSTHWAS